MPKSLSYCAHDFASLARRWKTVARVARVPLRTLATHDGFPILILESPKFAATEGIYISAGIHGDEPGGTDGLLAWAERHASELRNLPLLLLPCLNPWGLLNNRRSDSRGRDLNREWHRNTPPMIAAVRRLLRGRQLALALTLHEDYDARGIYLYEPFREKPAWGDQILQSAAQHLPIDPRRRIEGRMMTRPGLLCKRIDPAQFADMGTPEAVFLHFNHARRSFTFETPSEEALSLRVAAHVVLIEQAIALLQRR